MKSGVHLWRKEMKKLKIALAALLLCAGCSSPAEAPQSTSTPSPQPVVETEEMAELAQQQAQMLVSSGGALSVQYALMKDGELLISGQAGTFSPSQQRELSAQDQYTIGSVSKMFVTAAVMKLQQEGKLSLSDKVVDLLPEFEMADERYTQITVRMLLNHSSGLPGSSYTNGFTFSYETDTHDTFLDHLKESRLQADPGAYSVYSNDGFMLAELVVEAVSGQSLTEYLRENFFEPLGMTSTQTPAEPLDTEKTARLVTTGGREVEADIVNMIGTGGILSTAEDLCRFGQIFMPGNEVLTDASLEAMMNREYARGIWPSQQWNSLGYGLGWDSVDLYPFAQSGEGITALTKGGDTLLSHAAFTVVPQYGLTAVVLSSGGSSATNQLMANSMLTQALIAQNAMSEPASAVLPDEPEVSQPIDQQLAAMAGVYADSTSLYTIVFEEDGTLTLTSELLPDQPISAKHLGDGKFLYPSMMNDQLFSFEQQGGHTYLKVEAVSMVLGLGSVATTVYYVMKVEDNPLDAQVQAAWEARSGQNYLLVSEKPTSQLLEMMLPAAPVTLSTFAEGYVNAHQIVDENRALAIVQIPGTGSRDQFDYHFFTEEGVEYLSAAGDLYISTAAIPALEKGTTQVQGNDQGHIQWLSIDPQLASLTLNVTTQDVAFLVYDQNGSCVFDSVLDEGREVSLPQGGWLALCPQAGQSVELTVR